MGDMHRQAHQADECDKEATYTILAHCLEEKRAEAKAAECLSDEVREEYEGSISYRIGKLLCRNSR